MPVERLTKAENEITPAPTIVISELINRDVKHEKTIVHHESPGKEIKDMVTENDEDIVIDNTIEDLNANDLISESKGQRRPRNHLKVRWKRTQPVCKYTMNEIFLFGEDIGGGVTTVDTKPNITEEVAPSLSTEANDIKLITTTQTTDNTDTDGTLEDDVEEANMKLKVTDVHSFEEWKSLKLQEQESKLADAEPSPARSVRAKKNQVNYGSQDCGAKVLAHNKDAKHVSAILDENRDLYMLNPCANPIWFVIELCEPIQVQQIQLGNLELFSSAPKEFVVSVSERYPSREWRSIGTFEAANDKTLQSFNIKSNDVMFAKYIKFEMKSHFSNEHFCPLTLVRVLGISMVDEFDESEQASSKNEPEDDNNEDSSAANVEDSQQQDDGAINTMLNMVKNAMGLNDDAKKKATESVSEGEEDKGGGDNDTDSIDLSVESEVTLVTNHTEIAGLSGEIFPLVTLIKTGEGEDLTVYINNLTSYSPHIPLYVPEFIQYLQPVTQKLNAKVCWFLEFVCKVSLTSCLVHYPFNYSVFVPFSFDTSVRDVKANIHEGNNVNNDSEPVNHHKIADADSEGHHSPSNGHHSNSDVVDISNDDSAEVVGQVPTTTTEHVDDRGPDVLHQTDLVSEEPVKVQSCDVTGEDKVNPLLQLGDTKTQESDNILEVNKLQNLSSTSGVTEDLSSETVVNVSHEGSKVGNRVDTGTKQQMDESVEKQPNPTQPTVVINPVSPKDSVFMRLSNRIRALEQNMSLSSDYLENLSRRYKEQMDEMQRAFNKTTSKLVATSRTANENDAKQTELLKKAEAEIELLKKQIQNLSTSHDQLNSKLVERHFCLIVLELMIFIAVFVTCLGRRINHTQHNLERSDLMIQQLTQVIKELQQTHLHPPRLNGHCNSVPVENCNVATGAALNSQRNEKRKKKKLRQKNSNGSTAPEAPNNIENAKFVAGPGIENIGGNGTCSAVDKSCCDQQKVWNSKQLEIKIPGTYVKGRK